VSTQSAWDGATKQWAEHHDATMPEPMLQRMLTQARNHGKEIARLKGEVERLRLVVDQLHDEKREDRVTNAALRRVIHEGERANYRVDL
jgi:hypothetical protein